MKKSFILSGVQPTASCHASTVLALGGGEVLAAWFGGSAEGENDVAIYTASGRGGVFTPGARVCYDENAAHWNPVLHRNRDGTVTLFYKVGINVPNWYTVYTTSADNGRIWSESRLLVPGDKGGRGPVRNKIYTAEDGALLAPASTETKEYWRPFIDRSQDGGLTWTKIPIPVDFGAEKKTGGAAGLIQPAIIRTGDKLSALMRSTWGFIYRSDSADGGLSWGTAYRTALPNNNSGIDALTLPDGRIVLAYNPVSANWGGRTPLTLAVSADGGETFKKICDLETEPGEYSYPSMSADSGTLYITYTWNRQKISYTEISLSEIE